MVKGRRELKLYTSVPRDRNISYSGIEIERGAVKWLSTLYYMFNDRV